ncbi:MAG: hypothetical protein WBO92_00565 [Candidatus Moraniibacteriota bacterium]
MNRLPLTSRLARLKEWAASWRLTVAEMSQDYRGMFTPFQKYFLRVPRMTPAFSWTIFFLFGVATGFGLKTLAQSSLTIGHEDYRLVPAERLYALNTLRERALAAGANLTVKTRAEYPACTDETGLPSL